MPQSSENSKHKATVKILAERMAMLMTICIVKYGGNLSPWLRDGFYSGEAGNEIREMPEYLQAIQIVRNMVKREIARSATSDHKSANP